MRRPAVWASAIFALVALVVLWRWTIEGRAITPNALLYNGPPWTQYRPSGAGTYNGLLSDVSTDFYPWTAFAREAMRGGALPAWNPFALGGTPFFANAETALLSPFQLPFWLLPFGLASGLVAAAKIWIAAMGTYLLARQLALGFWPAVVSGVTYGLCSFNVVWLLHPHTNVSPFLPFVLWLVERLIVRWRRLDWIALGVVVGAALLGGHPGTQVHVAVAAALYALVRLAPSAARNLGGALRRTAGLASSAALGAGLAAIALLPAIKALGDGAGIASRAGGGISLPFSSLRTLAFPDWWGRPSGIDFGGPANYNERTLYVGSVALILALLALTSRRDWARKAPFVCFVAIGLLVPLGTPVIHALVVSLPGLNVVQDARLLLVYELGAALLAGFGLQRLLDASGVPRMAWLLVAAGSVVAVAAAMSLGVGLPELRAVGRHLLTGKDYPALPGVVSLTAVAWWGLALAALGALLFAGRRRGRVAPAVVALLVALDMVHFAHGYQPALPPNAARPPTTPALSYLQRNAESDRMVGLGDALPPDTQMLFGLRDVRGYDAPQPGQRYFQLWQRVSPEQPATTPLRADTVAPSGWKVLELLGAQWAVGAPQDPAPSGTPLVQMYRGPDATVYRDPRAAPRTFVAADARAAKDFGDIQAAIAGRGFVPGRTALVEGARAGTPVRGTTGAARIVRDEDSRVEVDAQLRSEGLVVLNDVRAPGWNVTVDGHPARALTVNGIMRGVVVPAGAHRALWTYAVPGLVPGALLSGVAALVVLAGLAWPLLMRRRRSVETTRQA